MIDSKNLQKPSLLFGQINKAETDGEVAEGGFKGSTFTVVTKVSCVAHRILV